MNYRVLLTDDELHILRAAEFKLKRHFEVTCASDGQEAWELLQHYRPDVLITDLQMPRMSGIDLIERIRADARLADLPVILLTAKGYELSTDDAFKRLKVFELVAKPFSPRELCKLVQMALEERAHCRAECAAAPVLAG